MMRGALICSVLALATVEAALGQTPNPPDPANMSRQELRDEVTRLRAITQNGAVSPNRPAGCIAPENRQFDFWLGEWDVSPTGSTSGVIVAESSIALADQGCVVIEHWRPFAGASGHSLNIYDPTTQNWHQSWMSAAPLRTEYRGAFENGVMALEALTPMPGVPEGARTRMSFQSIDADTVRQWGEQLNAGETDWTVTWDLTYRRRAGTQ